MQIFRNIIDILKLLYHDIKTPATRFNYISKIIGNIPGRFGVKVRQKVLRRYLAEMGENVLFWGQFTIFTPEKLKIGKNVGIAQGIHIQAAGGVTIGDNTIMGPYVKIWSRDHVYTDPKKPIVEQGYIYKQVIIGKNVWLGTDVFIMPGTTLGDGCIVAAGSVVGAKKYPSNVIIAGNPARVIGKR